MLGTVQLEFLRDQRVQAYFQEDQQRYGFAFTGLRHRQTAETPEPFTVDQPECLDTPFIYNSPHSGCFYPKPFLAASRLDALTLRKSEDTFVNELFADAPLFGAPLMQAHFPRAYLDLNREPYELDPELISESLPRYANTQSVRVVGGLGTIARVVTESEEIYRDPLPLNEALERINRLYKPYHNRLAELMLESHSAFGTAILIDCHSMPSNPSGRMRWAATRLCAWRPFLDLLQQGAYPLRCPQS